MAERFVDGLRRSILLAKMEGSKGEALLRFHLFINMLVFIVLLWYSAGAQSLLSKSINDERIKMENMTEVQSCTDIQYSLPPYNVTSKVICVTYLSQCHDQSALYKQLSFGIVLSLLLHIAFHNIWRK